MNKLINALTNKYTFITYIDGHTKSGAQYLRIYYLHTMCNITDTYEKWCLVLAYILLHTMCHITAHTKSGAPYLPIYYSHTMCNITAHTKSGAQCLPMYYTMCNITNCTYEKWCSVLAYIYYLHTMCNVNAHTKSGA